MRLFSGILTGYLALGAALALGSLGCGGSDDGAVFAANDGSVLGTLPTAEGGGALDGGAADGAASKQDGGDGAAAADAARKDNRIDPIEVGHAWTFDVTVRGYFPACDSGIFVSTAVASAPVDGRAAIDVQSFCPNAGVVKYSVDGDRVYARLGGQWRISLDSPVAEGHTWTDGFLDYRWESKGTITTPAGTFTDCWSATTVASYSSYIILCRGVGPVKWHYDTGFGNGYDAILTAKSF